MTLKQLLRDFIIGKDRFIPTRSLYKTTILRGYFAIIILFIGIFYFLIDTIHHATANLIEYALLTVAAITSFVLNRRGKNVLSSVIVLLVINISVYLYASCYKGEFGIQIFFITSGILAMGLFEYRQKPYWISFIALSFALFLFSNFSDYSFLEKNEFTAALIRSNFVMNYTMAFGLCVFLLFFLINLNHHSEKTLRENETNLIYTTEELKKSRMRFELAIKGSNAGIWEWNVASNVVVNSPVWKNMLGFEEHELNQMNLEGFLERLHPDDRDHVQQSLKNHLTKRTPYQTEFRMIRKDGSIMWVADSGVALLDAQGMTVQMVGSIIDITERKEAEQKIIQQNELLAKTNAELDRFVYSTSHDLKSPLSSLLGLITIAEKTDDPNEVTACLGMMKDRIRTMESFIREITDYSRNTRMNVKKENVKLFPLIHEIVENLRFSEGAENIFVRYNISPDLSFLTDENRLKVIMNNLIGNSIKYFDPAKDNPFISVEAVEKDNVIHISVEDNGIGIEKEHLERIFDMFYRASEKSKGSGLGLYIVKETIEKMEGKVQVTSNAGTGTRFSIQFPVIVQEPVTIVQEELS